MGLGLFKRIILSGTAVIGLLLALSTVALAADPGPGTAQVRVFNGTQGGGSVNGLDLVLRGQLNGKDLPDLSGRTDADGYLVFQNVATGTDHEYQVVASYQGVDYGSEPFAFAAGETTKSIRLGVYETSNSLDMRMSMAHTVIYPAQDSVLIKEYVLFANDTDRTYVGPVTGQSNGETLRFWLPPDATDLQLTYGLDPARTQKIANGFASSLPIYPGGREVTYSYNMKAKDGQFDFVRKVVYPTDAYDFLFQGSNVKLETTRLTRAEPLNINNIVLNDYKAANLPAGDTIEAKLSGLAAGGTGTTSKTPALWMALGAGVVVGAFGVTYWLRRKPKPAAVVPPTNKRDQLLADLAELDDNFEAGNIPEEAYKKLRASLKSELTSLIKDSTPEDR